MRGEENSKKLGVRLGHRLTSSRSFLRVVAKEWQLRSKAVQLQSTPIPPII